MAHIDGVGPGCASVLVGIVAAPASARTTVLSGWTVRALGRTGQRWQGLSAWRYFHVVQVRRRWRRLRQSRQSLLRTQSWRGTVCLGRPRNRPKKAYQVCDQQSGNRTVMRADRAKLHSHSKRTRRSAGGDPLRCPQPLTSKKFNTYILRYLDLSIMMPFPLPG